MAAHAVAHDADPATVELFKRGEDGLGKLLGDIRVHFVSLGPWILGCIDIESST